PPAGAGGGSGAGGVVDGDVRRSRGRGAGGGHDGPGRPRPVRSASRSGGGGRLETRYSRGGLMASMWRKAMLYLGLGPDDEYDDFDATGEQSVAPHSGSARASGRRSGAGT